jgi:glycine/D-amino acid oxidase-like deaminating enzyme
MEVRDMQKYDAIIIGTGQAGPPLAARLVDAGMKVALIERKSFGGTCVNTGCIPTKTLIASAYAAKIARRAMASAVLGTVNRVSSSIYRSSIAPQLPNETGHHEFGLSFGSLMSRLRASDIGNWMLMPRGGIGLSNHCV